MAISDTQKVDYLFKKIGYGVGKTDTSLIKSPSNESISSPIMVRGDAIWQDSGSIPNAIPNISSLTVQVYSDSLANTVRCTMDISATPNRTWLSNLPDWVTPEFGTTYQVKVFLDSSSSTTPETTGVQLFPNGSGGNDAWFFDYQSGILNFSDTSLPPQSFTGKSIYISGARYIGPKGIGAFSVGDFGNVNIGGNTIRITNLNGNLNLTANGGGYVIASNTITNTLVSNTITSSGNVYAPLFFGNLGGNVTGNVTGTIGSFANISGTLQTNAQPNITSVGNLLSLTVSGNVTSGSIVSSGNVTATSFIGNVYTNNIIGTSGNLTIAPSGNLTILAGAGAIVLPNGSTIQQPNDALSGSMRFNVDSSSPEYYTGNQWLPLGPSQITNQTINPDGISDTYTLDHNATSDGVLVSINGVLQRPSTSYLVSADQITFYDGNVPTPPLVTDIIDIRFVAAGVAIDENLSIVTTPQQSLPVTNTQIDVFNADIYRAAKYSISVSCSNTDTQLSDVLVTHNGTTATSSTLTNVIAGTGLSAVFSATLTGNLVQLAGQSLTANSVVRVQKTYFAI